MSKISLSHSPDTHRVTSYNPRISTGLHDRDAIFLGIDGGGSKTHAVLTDSRLRVIAEGFGGPANPARVGVDQALSSISDAIAEACFAAGISLDQVTSACAALAGVGDSAHYDPMNQAIRREFGLNKILLVTDARAALEGALEGEPGIVVIAGTGSIAMGVGDSGEPARSGGWGPLLGDEGSGYDIGRQALRAVAASFDGRAPRTQLTDLVSARLGIETPADLPAAIYGNGFDHAEIASLAELVWQAAQLGDAVAQAILADAGRALGELAVSVIRRLGLESRPLRIACVGSVFNSGEFVLNAMKEAVSRVEPLAEIGPPPHQPAIGAVKLARRHAEELSDVSK
jgi:N-acetylglucosamine kinase-like BadF-type ATPase